MASILSFNEYSVREAKGKSAVMTFGRFNPMTIGHEKLVDKVASIAKKKASEAMLFPSHSQDKKKNPLNITDKIKYLTTFFPSVKVMKEDAAKTPFTALKYLSDKGYTDVVMVVGSDRVKEFEEKIKPYIKHSDPAKSYEFDAFAVVSAGERDPDAEGSSGASGTKMREYAATDDFESFASYLPSKSNPTTAKKLFNLVKKGMNA